MLIINADDFGMNSKTNDAIRESFQRGWCSSSTLMANLGAFDEAIEIIFKDHLSDKIGLHINLTQGEPLTEELKYSSGICVKDQSFHKAWIDEIKEGKMLSEHEKNMITAEICAQFERVRNCGLPITHIDSHHHIHWLPDISKIIIQEAKKLGIDKVRLPKNVTYEGFKTTDFFGTIEKAIELFSQDENIENTKNIEIMCHPRKGDGFIADLDGLSLEEKLKNVRSYKSAVSYSFL